MAREFANRRVLIAGASAGIGKGIARAFAAAGALTVLGGRDSRRLEEASIELAALGIVEALPGDFSSAIASPALLEKAGALDILVINYGDTDMAPGWDCPDDGWEKLIAANLIGPARLARIAARGMKTRGRGVILFIGSICGHQVLGAPIAYNAGKTALRSVVKTMAHELGPFGVRVNLISPGNILFEGGRWAEKRARDPAKVQAMLDSSVPLRRFGTPDEIAKAALFLCSDAAAFITGADLIVDGGQTSAY